MKTNSISTGLARTIATPRHPFLRGAWLWTGFLVLATIAFAFYRASEPWIPPKPNGRLFSILWRDRAAWKAEIRIPNENNMEKTPRCSRRCEGRFSTVA